jgi:hypothetical protein
MALLERITSMRQQGASEAQIINSLREEGIPPLQINEAISQSKIKAAVASQDDGLQPSIMAPSPDVKAPLPAIPAPAAPIQQSYPQDQSAYQYQDQQYGYSQGSQGAYPQEGYQDQQGYAQQTYPPEAYYQQNIDVETIREIAKQIVEESMLKIKEEIASTTKMKSDLKFELQDIENRLIKIESVIQELQTAIIRKMGQYGESIANISEEIKATQDSFSKMVNPILDKKRNSRPKQEEPEEEQEREVRQAPNPRAQQMAMPGEKQASARTSSTSGIGVEDYFR